MMFCELLHQISVLLVWFCLRNELGVRLAYSIMNSVFTHFENMTK